MLKLSGSSLGKRQRELNEQVHRTVSENVDFSSIKTLEELSDVDRLYKINVALAQKNIDYVIETLKCGDSLYISKALKCTWLYESDYTNVINSDYLHNEIFPFMSRKMKMKFLKTISKHVRDETRAIEFHKYCSKMNMEDISFKFLVCASEEYKKEYLQNSNRSIAYEKIFFGTSFDLIDVYIDKMQQARLLENIEAEIYKFRYLYTVSNEKYLDLMEKYTLPHNNWYDRWNDYPKFGLRLSKHIVTKHKDRILNNTLCYFRRLKIKVLAKHTTVQDAMRYATNLLPPTVDEFWRLDFYNECKDILHILPLSTVYSFLKQIFSSKYPGEKFEMSRKFYDLKYYKLMTVEVREAWALEHLKQGTDVIDQEDDYRWYEFVNFDLAFKEIKKYIYVTTERSRRSKLVKILIDPAKTEEQRETLLSYYYERFVNEKEDTKVSFMNEIIGKWEVFKFGDSCWVAFNKLLYSLSVYSRLHGLLNSMIEFKTLSLIYHIIHQKKPPLVLEAHIMTDSSLFHLKTYCQQLTSEQTQLIYQYLMNICINKIKDLGVKEYNEVKEEIRKVIGDALRVLTYFQKTKGDCPDIMLKYVELDWDHYKCELLLSDIVPKEDVSHASLLRLLKKDSKLLIEKLSVVPNILNSERIKTLLEKLRIYFANDVAQDFLRTCENLLLNLQPYEYSSIQAVVFCIFQVAREDYKITFMSKYEPENAIIEHDNMDMKLLYIQEGICRFAHYSRPPVPSSNMLKYIKGDYVHYCLPLFNSYATNLPVEQCHDFISTILLTPVSIQKHGLRLAFEYFDLQDLKKVITGAWGKTKNVTLRSRIYTALCDKIKYVEGDSQKKLYEILKMFTLDLHEDDTDDVFSAMNQFNIPNFRIDFLETAWVTVNKLSDQKSKNILRKKMILSSLDSFIEKMDKKFYLDHILNDFIKFMLLEQNIRPVYGNRYLEEFIDEKWKLAAKFVIYAGKDESLELVNLILSKCIEMWDVKHGSVYTLRVFMTGFLDKILHYASHASNKGESIPVLQHILEMLNKHIPLRQIYLFSIKLTLTLHLKREICDKDDYHNLISDEITSGFASRCLFVLNELKDKDLLYPSFYDKIADLIVYAIRRTLICTNLCAESITVTVLDKLSESQLRDARMLALIILRQQESDLEKVKHIIEKIESFNDGELSTYIYDYLRK